MASSLLRGSALPACAAGAAAAPSRSSPRALTCQCAAPVSSRQQQRSSAHLRPVPQRQQQQREFTTQRAASWVLCAADTTASGSSGAPEGQVSAAIIEAMQAKIKGELQADTVVVSDVYGDGRHVSIDVVSSLFEGKTSVQRQRLVYKAIWMELQETVHAVDAMTTKTPQEAA